MTWSEVREKLKRKLRKPWRHRVRSFMHGCKRLFTPVLVRCDSIQRPRQPAAPAGLSRHLGITLTSYPPRFGTLALTLQSLLNQSVAADAVVLWVFDKDMASLPAAVRRLQRQGLRIESVPEDLRCYKKIIPALQAEPDSVWVTVDDDVFYPRHWLASLVEAHQAYPDDVICTRAHLVKFDEEGHVLPYRKWTKQTDRDSTDDPLFFTGIGGVLYPPGCFHPDVTVVQRLLELSPDADDVWLNWMVRLHGRRVRRVGRNIPYVTWLGSQRTALFRTNARGSGNDDCIRRMTQAYGPLALPQPAS